MGLFSQIKRSRDKTRLMAKVIDALKDIHNKQAIDNAIWDYYNFIANDYILGKIITYYNADYELVRYLILELNEMCGGEFGSWIRGQYLPVSTFGFSNSLEYALREYRNGTSMVVIWNELTKLM